MNELLAVFNSIRDIPYRIPLSPDEPDACCSGKAKALKSWLDEHGYESRYRVVDFRWSDMPLPPEVAGVPHADDSTHVYLEALLDGVWRDLDPTWDAGLAGTLPVAEWDGRTDTPVAVPIRSLRSHEESARIMSGGWDGDDILANGEFYRAFDDWLVRVRSES